MFLVAGSNYSLLILLARRSQHRISPSLATTMKATDKVIRDVTSWYHMMLVTNDVGFTLYVNGKEWFLNTVRKNFNFLRAVQTFVGATNSASTYNAQKLRGYMAEFHYVDGGGGLLPTDFAEYNDEGVWVPIKPSGITYGSAGFHLTFDPTQDTDPTCRHWHGFVRQ